MSKVGFSTKIKLREFLAESARAQTAVYDGSMEPTKVEKRKHGSAVFEDHRYEFPACVVTVTPGDFTNDFVVQPSAALIASLPDAAREAFSQVRVFSDFVATGERVPAIMVPPSLKEVVENLLTHHVGLNHDEKRSTYDDATFQSYAVKDREGSDMVCFAMGWEAFESLDKKLGQTGQRRA